MRSVRARGEARSVGNQLDRVAGVDLCQLAPIDEVDEMRKAGLAGLLDEDADRRLGLFLGGHGLLAGIDHQQQEPVDVALGDAVGGIEREGRLIVLTGKGQFAHLPVRLGQPVLRLAVGAQVEDAFVEVNRRLPVVGRCGGDCLLGQLAAEPSGIHGGRCAGVGHGETHR